MTPSDLLRDLVRLPSVNPMGRTDIPPDLIHEHRVSDYLEARLTSLGVRVERQPVAPGRDNVLAHFRPAAAPHTLLWEAHQDTVPTDGMTIDPFAADIRDGRLYGRGACDVKAGIAVMLAAFARLVRENPPAAAAVTVAFTVDEEHTFLGVQALARTVRADFAVVAEPTGLNLVTTHKGVVRWVLSTRGRACHSSRPEQGENAVYRMARVVSAIEWYADQLRMSNSDPRLGPPTISVGRIAGGASPNTVPDFCRIDVDRRLLPGESADAAEAELLDAIGLPVEVERILDCPALPPLAEGHPLLARLAAVIGTPRIDAVPYGTDASSLAQVGIPSVVFGPGDIAQAHTKDEWIELAQVDAAADILFRFAAAAS